MAGNKGVWCLIAVWMMCNGEFCCDFFTTSLYIFIYDVFVFLKKYFAHRTQSLPFLPHLGISPTLLTVCFTYFSQ